MKTFFKTAFLFVALLLAAFTIYTGVTIEPDIVSRVHYSFGNSNPTDLHTYTITLTDIFENLGTWFKDLVANSGYSLAIAPLAFKKLKLEKEMYKEAEKNGLSFTDILENQDPSSNYPEGTPDAFQRQLIAHDLKTRGTNVAFVQDFFKTSDSAVLFPEFINRNLLIGLNRGKAEATLDDVISTTTSIDSRIYKGIYADVPNSDLEYKRVSEGATFPRVIVKTKEKSIELEKIGLQFESTYEALKLSKVNVVASIVQLLGFKLGQKMVTEALLTLINGDGNSNPAGTVPVATPGTIVFADLLELEMAFNNFECEVLVGNKATIKKILLMSEFRDPLIGAEFLTKGTFTTPFGNVIKMNRNLPNGKLIGFNKKAGLEMLELKSMSLVESEKIIDKQFEKSVVSKTVGFSKIFEDSAFVLEF
jgi:hypothetical protein